MPNRLYRASYWLLKLIATHRGYSLSIITMIIWGGLMSLGNNNSGFAWQIISFTFVLAALLLAINPNSLKDNAQRVAFKRTGFLMIFSGVIMIGGYGMLQSGFASATDHPWTGALFGLGGIVVVLLAWILLALGLSIMAVESAQMVFDTFESPHK